MPGGASRPLDPASKAQHWQWSQLQGPARPSSFAGSRYRSRRASADRSHQQHARVMGCSPALTLPRRHKHECNAARAPRSADTRALQRGLTRQGSAQGGGELGGHNGTLDARGAHASRSPDPLVRLERQDGRRSPPITMVVKLALHCRYRACATKGAISGRRGQCSVSKGS